MNDKGWHLSFIRAVIQMRPIDSLPGNEIPILFIHGADDTFIPPKHSQNMQKATAGPSEIHLVPGAAHAASLLTDRDAYLSYVKEFLEKIQSS